MTRRPARSFEQFWWSYPLQNPSDVLYFLGGTLKNLRNCHLRTHEKRAMSLLSISCCQIDYTIERMARPREKTWMTKQIELIWRSMVCNGVNERRCEKYCAEEKVGLDWYVTTGLYFVVSALKTPPHVTLTKKRNLYFAHTVYSYVSYIFRTLR
jgi:hypothetical protein